MLTGKSENPALARGASGAFDSSATVKAEDTRNLTTEQDWPAAPDEQARREHLLHAIRSASLRMAASQADLNSLGVALKGRLISVEFALEWLAELGAMPLVEYFAEGSQ
jgi:hypothetical protein